MQNKVKQIKDNVLSEITNVTDDKTLYDLRVKYIGKKGIISDLLSGMGQLSIEEKKQYGPLINNLKQEVTKLFDDKHKEIELNLLNEKLKNEKIDISLPSVKIPMGSPNILEKLIEEIEELLVSMGYDVVDGPEIEEDKYNFEMLNIPKGHPARDAQDTFYIEGEEILLRSQTSPTQVRTMLANKGENPIRMICPGKTYRRDNDDATHSHQFIQIEGLLVDKDISLSDLKGTIDIIVKKLFGDSIELDLDLVIINSLSLQLKWISVVLTVHGHGCHICKQTGWITVAGAGIVHPNVLRMSGYDPLVWSGFAFGFGADRLAMLKYGIDDIRTFYNADLRELSVFDRKDSD